MSDGSKLIVVKTLHTLVWIFFNVVIFYFLFAVIADNIDKWVWICLGLIGVETCILLAFGNVCPITIVAKNYSRSSKDNFDIYLPNWLARYNKLIYSVIVITGIAILIYRLLM
jgi:hypothetical protein